jgi:hypothetical protein
LNHANTSGSGLGIAQGAALGEGWGRAEEGQSHKRNPDQQDWLAESELVSRQRLQKLASQLLTSHFLLRTSHCLLQIREWSADQHTRTIRPTILHAEQDGNRKDDDKNEEGAFFCPKMHEEEDRETSLDTSDGQHARKFLRDVDILVGDDELHARESEQANVNNEIFSDSTALVIVG